MQNCVVFEDGKLIQTFDNVLWAGLFSVAKSKGAITEYIQSCLPNNTLLIIPQSDGNINSHNNHDRRSENIPYVNWDIHIQPYIDYARSKNKLFIIGTLAQISEEPNYNYLYMPLDDGFFSYGVNHFFNKQTLPKWEECSSELCWRGSCSGVGKSESIRVKFVEKIYNYNPNTNVRLSNWWSDGKNIPNKYFAERMDYTEFTKYKFFLL
jgi:hypothetical protein